MLFEKTDDDRSHTGRQGRREFRETGPQLHVVPRVFRHCGKITSRFAKLPSGEIPDRRHVRKIFQEWAYNSGIPDPPPPNPPITIYQLQFT